MNQISVRTFTPPPTEGLDLPFLPAEVEAFDLEIGAGAGLHAVSHCLKHPERFLVALERTAEKFSKFEKRIARHESQAHNQLSNLLALRADAHWWLAKHREALKPGGPRLENVYLLYPNPYPKSSQANQRWHRSPFMGFLLKAMTPGSKLTLATNIQSYYEEALWYFQNHWKLEVQGGPLPKNFLPRTHFEKKYMEAGQVCYQLTAYVSH